MSVYIRIILLLNCNNVRLVLTLNVNLVQMIKIVESDIYRNNTCYTNKVGVGYVVPVIFGVILCHFKMSL